MTLRLLLMLALVAAASSGCTSLRAVLLSAGGTGVPAVQVGDHVVVTKKSGEKLELDVTAVETDALVGGNTRVGYHDIRRDDPRNAVERSGVGVTGRCSHHDHCGGGVWIPMALFHGRVTSLAFQVTTIGAVEAPHFVWARDGGVEVWRHAP